MRVMMVKTGLAKDHVESLNLPPGTDGQTGFEIVRRLKALDGPQDPARPDEGENFAGAPGATRGDDDIVGARQRPDFSGYLEMCRRPRFGYTEHQDAMIRRDAADGLVLQGHRSLTNIS
ncbi:hypothetical protein [Brevundimonas sp.]|uniref:hypothetical protein n=1 Tax=Brevundimonas sp. TaxID=1871086 RepID=UPI00272FE74D|nr:hypothetical protein [Brevundimonas sp.]MDP1914344.1 hypothetical protein [Brevundimonas sp.]